jgi:hypothetical protein
MVNLKLKWQLFIFSGEIRIELCSLVKFRRELENSESKLNFSSSGKIFGTEL